VKAVPISGTAFTHFRAALPRFLRRDRTILDIFTGKEVLAPINSAFVTLWKNSYRDIYDATRRLFFFSIVWERAWNGGNQAATVAEITSRKPLTRDDLDHIRCPALRCSR
jgi:hypothetical protein